MKCPVCEVDLAMAERAGLGIDYCPKCRGTWLEAGKLDKIIERSGAPAAPARPAPPPEAVRGREEQPYREKHDSHHGDSHDSHGYDKHGRKKSILDRLFD